MKDSIRQLNKIILIKSATFDYTEVEVAGNTCFVGTNGAGKTTILRALLFFYNADPAKLGIEPEQSAFSKYYFPSPTSYLIYEVKSPEGAFHICAFYHTANAIRYYFIDAPYDKDLYIEGQTVLLIEEVLRHWNRKKLKHSDQIDSYKRYKEILYGAFDRKSLEYKKYAKYALLHGNKEYQNIPKAITETFLSSKSALTTDFVKDFIVSSLREQPIISLEQLSKLQSKFYKQYRDVWVYLTAPKNKQYRDLAIEHYDALGAHKKLAQQLADELAGAYVFAQQEILNLGKLILTMDTEPIARKTFKVVEEQYEAAKIRLTKDLGAQEKNFKEAIESEQYYKTNDIDKKIAEYAQKEALNNEYNAQKENYRILTEKTQSIDIQFNQRFYSLKLEKERFELGVTKYLLKLDTDYENDTTGKKDFYKNQIKNAEKIANDEINLQKDILRELKSDLKELKNAVKTISEKVYFQKEIENRKDGKHQNEKEVNKRSATLLGNQKAIGVIDDKVVALEKMYKTAQENFEAQQHIKIQNIHTKIMDQEKRMKELVKSRFEETEKKIKKLSTRIAADEAKLKTHRTQLYGYLDVHYKDWKNTMGKIFDETILFTSVEALKPQIIANDWDTILGLKLDLAQLPIIAKTLADYQQRIEDNNQNIILLESEFKVFKKEKESDFESNKEKQQSEIQQLKDEINGFKEVQLKEKQVSERKLREERSALVSNNQILTLEIEQMNRVIEGLSVQLTALAQKAEEQRQADLNQNSQEQTELSQKIVDNEKLSQDIDAQLQAEIKLHKNSLADVIQSLTKTYNKTLAIYTSTCEEKRAEFAERESALVEEKSEAFKNGGIDLLIEAPLRKAIGVLEDQLKIIDGYRSLIEQYERDNEKFFSKWDEMSTEKTNLEVAIGKNETNFKHQKTDFDAKIAKITQQKKEYSDKLGKLTTDIQSLGTTIQVDLAEYKAFQNPIPNPNGNLTQLSYQLKIEEKKRATAINELKTAVAKFLSTFERSENIFSFALPAETEDATLETVEEKFINHPEIGLKTFIDQNKIAVYVPEVNKQGAQLIEIIDKEVENLLKNEHEIGKVIHKIEKELENTRFGNAGLVEYIKIAKTDSNSSILTLLQQIIAFKNPDLLFFNFNRTVELDSKVIQLLVDLGQEIKNQQVTTLRAQDLFDLEFQIKEGKNVRQLKKISIVGSTGTNVLVKSIIYITLIRTFIGRATEKSGVPFFVHCVIDEVGQLNATLLKELIRFATSRKIYLINGLPNESKAEAVYNFTHKIWKPDSETSNVIKVLSTEIEVSG